MDQEDRDRLIKIETDVSWLRSMFKTHVSEHFMLRILMLGSVFAAASALLVALM